MTSNNLHVCRRAPKQIDARARRGKPRGRDTGKSADRVAKNLHRDFLRRAEIDERIERERKLYQERNFFPKREKHESSTKAFEKEVPRGVTRGSGAYKVVPGTGLAVKAGVEVDACLAGYLRKLYGIPILEEQAEQAEEQRTTASPAQPSSSSSAESVGPWTSRALQQQRQQQLLVERRKKALMETQDSRDRQRLRQRQRAQAFLQQEPGQTKEAWTSPAEGQGSDFIRALVEEETEKSAEHLVALALQKLRPQMEQYVLFVRFHFEF